MTSAKIICDSVNPAGNRLTTFELKYPRIVHSELMTHRMFSRNTASSRAIPNAKLRKLVEDEPFIPGEWGANQKGMQAGDRLPPGVEQECMAIWLEARNHMLRLSQELAGKGVHKQLANRLLEPFQYITVLVSATEYSNWFHLRCHPAAQPQIRDLAEKMWQVYKTSQPKKLAMGSWHTPLIAEDEEWIIIDELIERHNGDREAADLDYLKVSVGRCARVSYLTHNGVRDISEDIRLCNDLIADGHWSPFEHVAMSLPGAYRSGNFTGFEQFRKKFAGENVTVFDEARSLSQV